MGSLGRRRFTRTEIRGGTGYWLVDATIGGHTYRWSTVDLDVPSDDGTLHYEGVLSDISYQVAMDLFQVANPHAVNIEASVEGMPEVLQSGRNLRGIAEASRWYAGQSWEDRVPKVRGRLTDPEVGEDFLTCAITAEAFNDTGRIPESTARVDSSTWATSKLGAADIGLDYPVVIGQPGRCTLDFDGFVSGAQALWVNKWTGAHTLLLAGHRIACSQVFLIHEDWGLGARFDVVHTHDSRGREVAVIDSTSGNITVDDLGVPPHHFSYPGIQATDTSGNLSSLRPSKDGTSEVYVAFYDLTDTDAGGAIGPDGRTIREAGDVLRFVLGYSSLRVDDGAFASAAQALSGFKIDAVIEAGCTPWQWVTDNLVGLLPVSFVVGPFGVRPIVFAWGATESDAVATFDEDNGDVEFDDKITIDDDHVINKWSLSYAKSLRTGNYFATARLDAEASESTAYAVGRIASREAGTDDTYHAIDLASTVAGPAGTARITLDETGAGESASYTSATRTLAVTWDDAVSTQDDIETVINGSPLSIVECEDSGSTDIWVDAGKSPVDLVLPDEGTAGSYHCRISQAYYRDDDNTGVFEDISDTDVVYDPVTANLVLQWKSSVYALEHRRVIVEAPADGYEWLDVGNVVLLNCERLALSSVLAHVEEIEIHDEGTIIFRCLMVWDPVRYSVL